MMIIEPSIAVRFTYASATRSAAAAAGFHKRSLWSADDVNAAGSVASYQLACTCGFEAPWIRRQKYTGTPFIKRNKYVKNRIRVSSENLGSPQDPVKKDEKSSYHPFEEIAMSTSENTEDARLTAAETSRTIIEVNSKATLMFTSVINDVVHENVVWPDMPYLTDDRGNIYFQVKNSDDVLQSLTSENNFVQVIVGVDAMEMLSEMDLSGPSEIGFGIEEIDDQDTDDTDDSDEEDEDEDENEEYDSEWVTVVSDNDEQEDADETLEDWAKLETMRSSHPMYFAKKLAESASDDPIDWMEQPPACVAIQGVIRPAFIEEHSTIQKHLSTNQSDNSDITESVKGEIGVINGHVHNSMSSKDNTAEQVENNENSDLPFNETSFYKLEMIKIQVISAHGHPTDVEIEDYGRAQPDALAHSASKIIARLKADGEKTLQAFKSVCWRYKSIQVEEAQLISVDSLGFDLRVCSGTQVQTLRFTFKKRATSEYSAERQLNELLFPINHPKAAKNEAPPSK
ncbi:hypothetical protein HN51_009543 [Arachis hypogaea]|uniref:DUF2470 domain-containing protein n=3 Tax=Arachis TaxID=3817 RepID=A0A445CZ40_ARAHY|nr:uncharacterized protein At3g49140 isoform X1 [Arachis hypogaea]QHO44063.1 uncharacterized protein DS421_5g168000 [Arachis hypogaea]RYR56114.1 hypothetical protein Ahy_A05g021905 isoform A [Arachis hypogaea]